MMNCQLIVFVCLVTIVSSSWACSCGRENIQTRIINGRDAQRNRYPWIVSVLGAGGCAGTVINDRYILTAAHCMNGANNTRLPQDKVRVILGAHNIKERWARSGQFRQLDVEWYKIHPNAGTVQLSGAKLENDIALIKLKDPLTFNSQFNPVCLANFSRYNNLFSIGWGYHFNGKLTDPKNLQEVEVDEVDTITCKRVGLIISDARKQICAGTRTGVCNGDSGGPMSTRINGHVYQVAIASYVVNACGTQGGKRPDVYVRLTGHMDWIEKQTQDAKWCDAPDTPKFKRDKIIVTGEQNEKPIKATTKAPTSMITSNNSEYKLFTVPSIDGNPPFNIKVHKSNLNKFGSSRIKINIRGKNIILIINN